MIHSSDGEENSFFSCTMAQSCGQSRNFAEVSWTSRRRVCRVQFLCWSRPLLRGGTFPRGTYSNLALFLPRRACSHQSGKRDGRLFALTNRASSPHFIMFSLRNSECLDEPRVSLCTDVFYKKTFLRSSASPIRIVKEISITGHGFYSGLPGNTYILLCKFIVYIYTQYFNLVSILLKF